MTFLISLCWLKVRQRLLRSPKKCIECKDVPIAEKRRKKKEPASFFLFLMIKKFLISLFYCTCQDIRSFVSKNLKKLKLLDAFLHFFSQFTSFRKTFETSFSLWKKCNFFSRKVCECAILLVLPFVEKTFPVTSWWEKITGNVAH